MLNNKNAKQSEVNTALRALQKAQVVLRPFANGTVNLALNKVVSSRNTYEDGTYFSLSFLTDGVHEDISVNSHQGWSVDPYSRLDRDAVVDLTLDLDAVYRITSVKLRPCLYNQGNSMPEDFEIQLSRDGKEFVTVKTVEGLMLEEALDQPYTVDAVEARYIRIHITKHSAVIDAGQGGALSQIGEIEAELRRMAEADLPFEKEHWTREQAVQYFEKMGWTDKAELMRYRPRREIMMYRMGGLCE